jgi:3-phenylpropionate/trans-cinnamate dioxygenase ferredoxin reductase subunit
MRLVIVGGGVAAHECAFALRREGFDGEVVMLSAESLPPYDRTWVSKGLITGDRDPDDAVLSPTDAFEDADIRLELGTRAVGLDVSGRRVLIEGASPVAFDRLIVCSGGEPRLPVPLQAPGVLTVRELADSERLRTALEAVDDLTVVGAGFIGGEVASAGAKLGKAVTLVEAAAAPLARVLGNEVAARIRALHVSAGIDVQCGVAVTEVERRNGGFGVRLADGRSLAAAAVVAGVGMAPAVGWLEGSGVECRDGVLTDDSGRTSADGVLAAGDCARWRSARYGAAIRIEHWDTALRHGAAVAAAALGRQVSLDVLPFHWSEQHGVMHQWVGHAPAWDKVEIEDVDPPRAYVARYYANGDLVGVFAAGQPKAIAIARRELGSVPRLGTPRLQAIQAD